MEKTSEKYLEKKFSKKLKDFENCKCLKYTSHNVAGYPDRLVVLPHCKCLWVEFKTTDCKLSKIQRFRHNELKKLDHKVYTVDNELDLDKLIREIKRECEGEI